MIPAIAFFSMLTTRLILYFLLRRIDQQQSESVSFPSKVEKTEFNTTTTPIIEDKQAIKIPETSQKWSSIFTMKWWFGRTFMATIPTNRSGGKFDDLIDDAFRIDKPKTKKSNKTIKNLMEKESINTTTSSSSSITSGHGTKNRRKRNKQKNE